MTKFLIPILTLIIFTSCQKEFSESNDGQQPTEEGGRLVKLLKISGTNNSDTSKTEYSYDLSGNLEIEKTEMKVRLGNGTTDVKHFYTHYYRDPLGRIIKVARKGPYSDNGNNVDTLFDYVTYKSATSKQVKDINNGARVYIYADSSDRVSATEEYMPWPNPTDPAKVVVRHIYIYDEDGNIEKRREYTDLDGNGVFEENALYMFSYDDKKNPLYSKDDALIEWRWALMSPGNVVKQINIFFNSAGGDEILTDYEYRPDNLPRSGVYILGSDPIILKYYYE